jgi:UDP-GlcNAc:undecaprenyl-phosphate GlcNAc-1-phosphate transferase
MASYLWPLGAFFLPLAVSLGLCRLLIRLAPKLGLVDLPGERKVHTQATPRGGGLAIYLALVVGAFSLGQGLLAELVPGLVAGFLIVVLGLVDDLHPLPWRLRLGVQIYVAAGVVLGWYADRGWPFHATAIFWLVAMINALNMLDNMDALSAGVAWIAACGFAIAWMVRSESSAVWRDAVPDLILMGALSGFLYFNWPPARLFMGDAGSTFLGLFLGLESLKLVAGQDLTLQTGAMPVFILAVPCYDMTSVVILRLWQGRSPFHADKQHLSHRLVRLGLRPPVAVRVIYLLALASGLGGLALLQTTRLGAVFLGVQLGCLWLAVAAVEFFRHLTQRSAEEKNL